MAFIQPKPSRRRSLSFCALALLISQTLAQTESEKVTISVSPGLFPTFSWAPDSAIGRLLVENTDAETWGTETEGRNVYRSPIRYGIHPPESAEDEPAMPLIPGRTYRVSLFRWISVEPEQLELFGTLEFIPSTQAEGVEEIPVAGIRRALRVGTLPDDFRFDGTMNSPAWRAATDSIADLVTIEPDEGGVPAGRTIVKVLANQHEIVVGARCYDIHPDGIVSFSKARDTELEEEDHILVVLDTFLDGRSGYVFAVNPSGSRFDGLVEKQGEDVNSDWDAIWEARTTRDETGWCAEIRIPIKSLGFKKDLTTWGFNVQRRVQRLQETSRWSGAKRDYEIYQTSRAGLLTNLPHFDFGAGLSIRPSGVGRAGRPAPGMKTDYDADLSLDLTQKLGPNLLSALTVNTDFAETEVDVRQINVTRFPLFFPEKRTFFLEGADIFEFGVGLDEEKLVPFFSRRIGLLGIGGDDQSEIPINVGGKINGRIDNTNIAALVVNTRKVDSLAVDESKMHVPQTTMGALRFRQNVLEESSLGILATFGDQQGRSGSWSLGGDFTYRTSSFLEDKNFIIGFWGMVNDRHGLNGDKSAFGFKIDYPNDLLSINVSSIRIGDGFDPSLGFTPRNNLNIWEFSAEYKPRPSWEFVRQMFYDLTVTLFNNRNNSRWESYFVKAKPLSLLLESGDRFEAVIERHGDRPPEEFEVSSDVDIPAGSYEWTRYVLEIRAAEKRQISGEVKWASGDFYNGTLNTIEGRLTLRPSSLITLELTGERNIGRVLALPDEEDDPLIRKKFLEELYGFRIQLNFSPDLQFSSLTQYDTQSKELGSNNKLRWTFHPLGDIFIVYNHNLVRRASRWAFVSNQLPIKIQYAWRF